MVDKYVYSKYKEYRFCVPIEEINFNPLWLKNNAMCLKNLVHAYNLKAHLLACVINANCDVLAPEVAEGTNNKGHTSKASDVYAFAMTCVQVSCSFG